MSTAKPKPDLPVVLTRAQARQALNVSPPTFAAILRSGRLPAYELAPGGCARFLLSEVMALLVPVRSPEDVAS